MSNHAPIAWLLAGLGCVAAGVVLVLSVSPEAGIALFVVGAGVLAAGAAAAVSGRESSGEAPGRRAARARRHGRDGCGGCDVDGRTEIPAVGVIERTPSAVK